MSNYFLQQQPVSPYVLKCMYDSFNNNTQWRSQGVAKGENAPLFSRYLLLSLVYLII